MIEFYIVYISTGHSLQHINHLKHVIYAGRTPTLACHSNHPVNTSPMQSRYPRQHITHARTSSKRLKLLLCICVWHSTFHLGCFSVPLKAYQQLPTIPIIYVFFRHACHANSGSDKSVLGQAHVFLCICCGSFQIYMLIVTYHFARIDHDTDLSFLF